MPDLDGFYPRGGPADGGLDRGTVGAESNLPSGSVTESLMVMGDATSEGPAQAVSLSGQR